MRDLRTVRGGLVIYEESRSRSKLLSAFRPLPTRPTPTQHIYVLFEHLVGGVFVLPNHS